MNVPSQQVLMIALTGSHNSADLELQFCNACLGVSESQCLEQASSSLLNMQGNSRPHSPSVAQPAQAPSHKVQNNHTGNNNGPGGYRSKYADEGQ